MSGVGRKALPDFQGWSEDLPRCPRLVERPSRMSGVGREALRDDRGWSEALQNVRDWSEGPCVR